MTEVIELSSDSEITSVHDDVSNDCNIYWDIDDYHDRPAIDYNGEIHPTADSVMPMDSEEKQDESDNAAISDEDDVLRSNVNVVTGIESDRLPASQSDNPLELGGSSSESVKLVSATEKNLRKNDARPKPSSQSFKVKESKEERERKRKEKELTREEKKSEMMREKALKTALANKLKSIKPEENIKLITVHIDTNIINSPFGSLICSMLQQLEVKYKVESLNKPNTVVWTKMVKDHVFNNEEKLIETETLLEEDELIAILLWKDVITLVAENELQSWLVRLKSGSGKSKITILLCGMEKYFNHEKKKINRALAAEGSSQTQKRKKTDEEFENIPSITLDTFDLALTEIQLFLSVNHRFAESAEEVATFIMQFTKSISQKQYKQDMYNREKDSLSWFAKGDNKSCVKVDKSGIGLASLWQQQICQFNNVGLEVAQAIVGKFASPQELLNAYKNCQSHVEAATLLQDIGVRREAGVLSSTRRVGPELSKKIHKFFTDQNPNTVI